MAKLNPWVFAAGGAALAVGVGVWFATRKSTSTSPAAAASVSPVAPTVQTTTYLGPAVYATPPPPNYSVIASDASYKMSVGQILQVTPPHPAGDGQSWSAITFNPQEGGGLFTVTQPGTNPGDPTNVMQQQADGTFLAVSKGTGIVRYGLFSSNGGNVETYDVTITVS